MGNSALDEAQFQGRTRRPTVMDMRFRGDPWVEDRADGTLFLCLGNYPLATVQALTIDQPHFNQVLSRLRQGSRGRG
jgi:hypothetical protein